MISIHHAFYPTGEKTPIFDLASYSHEINLLGGFRSASFSFNAQLPVAEHWFRTGVGRHINAFNSIGNLVWEGVVNEVSFDIGQRSIKIGPLLGISNRINVGWQYPNYGIPGDSLAGVYEETGWDENVDSQAKYGVLEELVSGGTSEYDEAFDLRDRLLDSKSGPGIVETLAVGGEPSPISISVSCVGYSRILEKQVYNLYWESGLTNVDLSEKINSILDASLYFVNERVILRDMQTSGITVDPVEEDSSTAWEIINDHIAKSYLEKSIRCGFFSGMQFSFEIIEPVVTYWRKTGDSRVFGEKGNQVENSEIMPGGFMTLADFSTEASYRIDSVRYDLAGDSASINYHENSLRAILAGTMLGALS